MSHTVTLWDVPQTRQELGNVCRRTLHNFTRDPENPLPYIKLGTRVMFDPNDVRAWIESQKKRTGGSSDVR